MAYQGGGISGVFKPDLTTRAGARSATHAAKIAFLFVGGIRALLYIIGMAVPAAAFADLQQGLLIVAFGLVTDVLIFFFAAWRLHVDQGAFISPVATVIYVLGILLSFSIPGLVVGLIITGVFISGCRGAWALRRGTGFDDDHYDTFA